MRLAIFLVSLSLAIPAAAARQQLDTLKPADAISRAAAASPKAVRAVFQFKVGSAAKARGGYWLDGDENFRSATNLGIVIRRSAMPGLTQKYGQDLKSAFVGKTIKVIGRARRVAVARGRATATQVEVTHAGQILSVS